MRLLIVGAGNMGQAYAKALLDNKIVRFDALNFLEKVKERSYVVRETLNVDKIFHTADEFISKADVLLLAVKPQDAKEMFDQIRPFLKPRQLAISIMAGVRINAIQEMTGLDKVARAMPNLALLVGEGMTVYTATASINAIEKEYIDRFLRSTGKSLFVEEEEKLDAATAVSGSGPAYVFYFMQAMIDSAIKMGFSYEDATLLVVQTLKGSIAAYQSSNESCEALIKKVASKGGTTEAALKIFNDSHLQKSIQAGMQKALERAIELSSMA